MIHRRRAGAAILAAGLLLWSSATAFAQLDPLLFLKRVPPNVVIVMDTSMRMLEDGSGNLYDPVFYAPGSNGTWDTSIGAFANLDTLTTKSYRRIFRNLLWETSPGTSSNKYTADSIAAVPQAWDPGTGLNSNNANDLAFMNNTRFMIAKQGIATAVQENVNSVQWGLLRLRQVSPQWRQSGNCDKPVRVLDAMQATFRDSSPCKAYGSNDIGRFGIYLPSVGSPAYSQAAAPAGTLMVPPAANNGNTVLGIVNRPIGDDRGLVPASMGGFENGASFDDRPLNYALIDAKTAVQSAMAGDSASSRTCRNTVVILIAGGKDSGNAAYVSAQNIATTAGGFTAVTGGGVTRHVPIFVISVKAAAAADAQLQSIATSSGGEYFRATTAIDVSTAIARAVAVAYKRAADFDAGTSSEYQAVSPIVGTVNLKNANDANGNPLPNTDIESDPGGQPLQQRSNMLITAGFTLPNLNGKLRAFRAYRPERDDTKTIGWKFTKDGTRLWPDLDGRPTLAGLARTPADPNTRNIYTYVPDGSGGGSLVAFTTANAATLAPAMGTGANTATLISYVRSQQIGAIIGSTPALMDPPSLDPPPDDDYGRTDAAGTFAGDHKDRRAMIFVGANDGMMHAIDARTGYEVWAYIPYNLLPKLQTLVDGQPIEQFDYFVDSSPKIAEVKLNGRWRSLLIFGEGPGGIFYQCFDVTEAGMGVDPAAGDLGAVGSLLSQFDAPGESIAFKWAYPNYSDFDPTFIRTFTVYDNTSGGRLKLWGDLKVSASYAEKTVGFTWSDPAVGALDPARTVNAVIVGSGYFPDIESQIPARSAASPKAGNALYLINADTGALIGNGAGNTCPTIASGVGNSLGCVNVGDVAANGRKNAIQADPSAAGASGSNIVSKAYVGDIDGRYWRFNFTSAGRITVDLMADTGSPIYASSALLFVGTSDVYMFFSTGSDLLSVKAPGGTGTFRLYALKDNAPAAGSTTKFSIDLTAVTSTNGSATGERPSASPSVAGDIVFYTTNLQSAATPCADFTSNLYAVTYAGTAAYDANNNGRIDTTESKIAKTLAGRATAPFIVDQHLYFGTAGDTGSNLQSFGDPEDYNNGIGQVGVRILSWREIR